MVIGPVVTPPVWLLDVTGGTCTDGVGAAPKVGWMAAVFCSCCFAFFFVAFWGGCSDTFATSAGGTGAGLAGGCACGDRVDLGGEGGETAFFGMDIAAASTTAASA